MNLGVSQVFSYFKILDCFTTKNYQALATSMLEYSKTILEKVSFDSKLFEKELLKALKMLMPNDRQELQTWVIRTFGLQYQSLFTNYKLA